MSPRPTLWQWEDAFDKFGFDDGDGPVETSHVEHVLREAGFETASECFGLHNTVIVSIKRDGVEMIPFDDPDVTLGYSNPRDYLPREIIALFDSALP